MRQTIRRFLPRLTMLVTCVAGVVLATLLSVTEVWIPGPPPRVPEPPPPPASATPPPVQEATPEPTMEQDCQACARLDEYCRLCLYLEAIEITSHDEEDEVAPRFFKNLSWHPIYVDLGLGELIENEVMVRLHGADPNYEFKVEQQYETSLVVSDEGPHMDLTDWKHYRSSWRELKRLGDGQFLTLKLSEADRSRFPAVTMKEVYREVSRRDQGRWAKLVRQAKTVNDGPLMVLVSKFSLRIKVKVEGQWVVIKQLEFFLPMGC